MTKRSEGWMVRWSSRRERRAEERREMVVRMVEGRERAVLVSEDLVV